MVPFLHLPLAAPVVVAGEESFVSLAITLKGLQLTGTIDRAVSIVSDIEGNDTDRVTRYEEIVFLLIVECKSKNAVEIFQKIDTLLPIERKDHFAVGASSVNISICRSLADFPMVIDFSVDRQRLLPIGCIHRLFSTLRINDGKTLMTKNGRLSAIDTTPIRTTVAYFPAHGKCFLTQLIRGTLYVEYAYDSAHISFCSLEYFRFAHIGSLSYPFDSISN